VLFTSRNQKNGGLAEYFESICYPCERVHRILFLCLMSYKYVSHFVCVLTLKVFITISTFLFPNRSLVNARAY